MANFTISPINSSLQPHFSPSMEGEVTISDLPIDMINEILKWMDSNAKNNLSVVSKKWRNQIQTNEQKLHKTRQEFICQKIKSIVAKAIPLGQNTYNWLVHFFLGIHKYREAKEAFSKITDLNCKANLYCLMLKYSFVNLVEEETNELLDEAISFVLIHNRNLYHLNEIAKIFMKYGLFQQAKFMIAKFDSLESQADSHFHLALAQIKIKDLQGASQTLQDMVNWAEYIFISVVEDNETQPKSYLFATIALLLFQCGELKAALRILEQARSINNEKARDEIELIYTYIYLAKVYLQIGCKEEGLKLLEEAKSKFLEKEKVEYDICDFIDQIAVLYKKYNEDYLLSDLFYKAIISAENYTDADKVFYVLRKIVQTCKEIKPDRQTALDIVQKIKEVEKKVKFSSEEYTRQSDLLFAGIVTYECEIQNYQDAISTAKKISEESINASSLFHIGESLLKSGRLEEGIKFFLNILEEDFDNSIYFKLKVDIAISFAKNRLFDEAVEIVLKNSSHGHIVSRLYIFKIFTSLLRIALKQKDLQSALLLLNQLPNIPNTSRDEYIKPLLNITNLMAEQFSHYEREQTEQIQEALELTDMAKWAVGNLGQIYNIAKAKAKIGDIVCAQNLLVEVRGIIFSEISMEQEKKSNETINPILSRISDIRNTAILQADLDDFGGALETISIFEVCPDVYIEALIQISKRKPRFM